MQDQSAKLAGFYANVSKIPRPESCGDETACSSPGAFEKLVIRLDQYHDRNWKLAGLRIPLLSTTIHLKPGILFIIFKMGFILPAPYSPREQVRTLMTQKENIEAEIDAHVSVLKANNSTLQSPLVDNEGFPRDDLGAQNIRARLDKNLIAVLVLILDVYQVRNARVQIIRLRNDLKAVSDDIGKALEAVYDPASAPAEGSNLPEVLPADEASKPFAKVDGVAPGSPAAEAVRTHELIVT